MTDLTEAGQRLVAATAARHGLSEDAVLRMLVALQNGGGTQAQFNIPELGGMGQWSMGGMTMVGDMFNSGLQARVASLCADLAEALRGDPLLVPSGSRQSQYQAQYQGGDARTDSPVGGSTFFAPDPGRPDWPPGLGHPASQGAQNDMRYAWFPDTGRLAVARGGDMWIYDTGQHRIGGVSQAQGGGQSLAFSSQLGQVSLADLTLVSGPGAQTTAQTSAQTSAPNSDAGGTRTTTNQPAGQPAVHSPSEPPRPTPHPDAQSSAVVDGARDAATDAAMGTEPAATTDPAPRAEPSGAQHVSPPPTAATPPLDDDQIFSRIERLADLRDRGILDEAEFEAKKTELLARL